MNQADKSKNLQPMFDKTSNTNEISTPNSSLIAERNFTSLLLRRHPRVMKYQFQIHH